MQPTAQSPTPHRSGGNVLALLTALLVLTACGDGNNAASGRNLVAPATRTARSLATPLPPPTPPTHLAPCAATTEICT